MYEVTTDCTQYILYLSYGNTNTAFHITHFLLFPVSSYYSRLFKVLPVWYMRYALTYSFVTTLPLEL